MFPGGMVVKADTKRVLTNNIEEIFYIIGYFSKNYKHKKSRESNKKFDFPTFVPESGNLSKIIIKDMELIERFIYAFVKKQLAKLLENINYIISLINISSD